jgi:mannose-1-phosphate guanylyltransferase/phosphomannomutase
MKRRVTLTIEQDILAEVDDTIDGSIVKNRSHAFEVLIKKALGKKIPSKAVILAGGEDTGTPKSMMKVNGKPVLQYNIEMLRDHGISDIIISIGNGGDVIKDTFGDGSDYDVTLEYVREDDQLGTAGPLNLADELVDETFVMLNGDEIKDINLEDMFEFHKEHDGFATIALTTVSDPSEYGVAVMNGGKIVSFIEKPSGQDVQSNLINAGLYIMDPDILDLIPEGYAMLENDVFPKLARKDKLFGYPFSGRWMDPKAKYKISLKKGSVTKHGRLS